MKWFGILLLLVAAAWFFAELPGAVPGVGEVAPSFRLPDQEGKWRSLDDYAKRWIVLYFYPRDDTPGCTREACQFRDDLNQLDALGAQVVGVSVDDTDSHARFAAKYHLPFPLLADHDGSVAARYGALRHLGWIRFARRYTFLIDPQGRIAKAYLKVDTSRHSTEIIDDLERLKRG